MPLPDGFVFSSNSLQDFVECQRRFQLRYMDHLVWPAVEVEPYKEYERMVEQDALFHKIVLQHLNGISARQISIFIIGNEDVNRWLNNYLVSIKDGLLEILSVPGTQRYEEVTLSIPVEQFRLLARFDLLVIQAGHKATIVELMTGKARPDRKVLEDRLHTHVAPLVLAGASLNLAHGSALDPNQIEMVYWFAEQPGDPEHFTYDISKLEDDRQYLTQLIHSISQLRDPVFPLTPDVRRCLFCTYRSLCDRGVKPGEFEDWTDWLVTGSSEANVPDSNQVSEPEY